MEPDEAARQEAIERQRQRRQEVRRQVEAGLTPALPDMTDEELGEEAVRLVKQSRRKRMRSGPDSGGFEDTLRARRYAVHVGGELREVQIVAHECPARPSAEVDAEDRPQPAPTEWGEAIADVIQFGGTWWAVTGNEPPEYATRIRYCPWCAASLEQGDETTASNPEHAERLREAEEDKSVVRELDEAAGEIDRGEGRSVDAAAADLRRKLNAQNKPGEGA